MTEPKAKRKPAKNPQRKRQRKQEPSWVHLSDAELLEMRFCDLRLSLKDTAVEKHVDKLEADLLRRGIRFRPHLWLSTEWFSPDGVPGIAVPFYMAHPRLKRLERNQMEEVEGGNENWLRRILRHELAHALDNAFRLRRRKDWRRVFGKASRPYPNVYNPRPASQRFVLHLGHWYAQSHPTEDFAETFAVWMQPKARWRREYEGWPALRKLEYVDELMESIRGEQPVVRNRELIEPLHENCRTLGQHYRWKRKRYDLAETDIYDLRLKRIFGKRLKGKRAIRASRFIRQAQPELERFLIRRTRLHPYLVRHVLHTVIQRCRELELVLDTSQRDAKRAVLNVVERILMDILRRDHERFAL